MQCPKCSTALPSRLLVQTEALRFEFQMGVGPDGLLRRLSDLTLVEKFDPESPAKDTHFTTCGKCKAKIDVTTIEVKPVCVLCGKEKAQLTVENNTCWYNGLVCIECAKANQPSMCRECSRTAKCKLYARAVKEK
jgi:hypothetical protein